MLSGLIKRGKYWHIDKQYRGHRITGSTKETERQRAEEVLLTKMEQVRNQDLFGIIEAPPFHEILVRYCEASAGKRTVDKLIQHAELLIEWLGDVPIDELNDEAFDPLREHLRKPLDPDKAPLTPASINRVLEVARAALRAAHLQWRTDTNEPLLKYPVHIKMYPKSLCTQEAERRPYPLAPQQELAFFQAFTQRAQNQIPPLQFVRHTGLRDQECCTLTWQMEQYIPEIKRSIFYIDGKQHKNGFDRVVVLNDKAWDIVENQRGKHKQWVFPSTKTERRYQLTTKQFRKAWTDANLPTKGFRVGVHNLRHTLGARLLQVGCPERYIRIFLGHTHANVTDIYTAGEITAMIDFANQAAEVTTGVITRQIYDQLSTLDSK